MHGCTTDGWKDGYVCTHVNVCMHICECECRHASCMRIEDKDDCPESNDFSVFSVQLRRAVLNLHTCHRRAPKKCNLVWPKVINIANDNILPSLEKSVRKQKTGDGGGG